MSHHALYLSILLSERLKIVLLLIFCSLFILNCPYDLPSCCHPLLSRDMYMVTREKMLLAYLKELAKIVQSLMFERLGKSNNNYVLYGILTIGSETVPNLLVISSCIDHSNAATKTNKFNKLLQKLDELINLLNNRDSPISLVSTIRL